MDTTLARLHGGAPSNVPERGRGLCSPRHYPPANVKIQDLTRAPDEGVYTFVNVQAFMSELPGPAKKQG